MAILDQLPSRTKPSNQTEDCPVHGTQRRFRRKASLRRGHVRNRLANECLVREFLPQVFSDQSYRRVDHFIFDPFVNPQVVRELDKFPVVLPLGGLQQVLDRGQNQLVMVI